MRVLFICSQNKYRSKAAELLFRDRFETRSAGLHGGRIVEDVDLEWAEAIVVMEEEHRLELVRRFPLECLKRRLLTLGVPDCLPSSQLPEMLERKMRDVLG